MVADVFEDGKRGDTEVALENTATLTVRQRSAVTDRYVDMLRILGR